MPLITRQTYRGTVCGRTLAFYNGRFQLAVAVAVSWIFFLSQQLKSFLELFEVDLASEKGTETLGNSGRPSYGTRTTSARTGCVCENVFR